MKYLDDVTANIKQGKNVIFFKQDVYPYYKELKKSHNCIYLNEPTPVKPELVKILEKITDERPSVLNRMTITDQKEAIIKSLGYKTLVIMFNHFDKLTKSSVEVYIYLNSIKNIIFVANSNGKFSKDVYYFYKKFEFINKNEYESSYKKNEINVTYALYFILGAICFALYLKFALSLCSGAIFISVITMGALWFSFIVFRTLIFAGGRI
ncbi:MAG: hypothetical protein ACXVH2_11030 [Methanobacterium sp.]